MATMKNKEQKTSVGEDVKKLEGLYVVEMQNGVTVVENHMAVP